MIDISDAVGWSASSRIIRDGVVWMVEFERGHEREHGQVFSTVEPEQSTGSVLQCMQLQQSRRLTAQSYLLWSSDPQPSKPFIL